MYTPHTFRFAVSVCVPIFTYWTWICNIHTKPTLYYLRPRYWYRFLIMNTSWST